jgi:cell wall-associated NlpC family hydrolase
VRIALLSAALLLAPGPSWAQTLTVVNGVQVISGNDPAPVRARPKPARAKTRSATRASARSSAVTDESPIADLIVQRALAYQGVPYVFGGTSPRSGFDCSGFVQYVFATVGIRIPRTADAQFAVGRIVPPADPEPGDLVFFQTYDWGASHVGIYLGGGKFVQEIAPNVHISDFNNAYFRRRYIGARRLIPS